MRSEDKCPAVSSQASRYSFLRDVRLHVHGPANCLHHAFIPSPPLFPPIQLALPGQAAATQEALSPPSFGEALRRFEAHQASLPAQEGLSAYARLSLQLPGECVPGGPIPR